MTGPSLEAMVAALGLPERCRVDQRVPKKMLVENGAPTAADKRQISDGVEAVQWVASLKPTTVGVAEYRADNAEYLEIAVLTMTMRRVDGKPPKSGRLAELVHRAVPYPVFLVLAFEQRLELSLAHKRWAHNEAGKVVLDGEFHDAVIEPGEQAPEAALAAFFAALDLGRQPGHNLHALYQGWIDTLGAWQAVSLTGQFMPSPTPEQAEARRVALRRCQELDARITSLRVAANKEKQMARQVALNLELKTLLAERQQLVATV